VSVAFVFTNPRHHLEMMKPVADELARRGIATELVSLAELRGLDTPRDASARRAIPFNFRRRPAAGAAKQRDEAAFTKGRFAQRVVWSFALGPRMRMMLARARIVVVPNDAVFPYIELLAQCRARGVRSVLMQEGIRFALPDGYAGPTYGGGGTSAVCVWGEGSADHFVASHIPRSSIRVTGAPRLDTLDPSAWREPGAKMLSELGLASAPLSFLSNPIEIQGYGTKELKLDLFAKFLTGAAPVVRAGGIPVLVKCHLHEDPGDFARIAAASPIGDLVKVSTSGSIFAAIAASRAAVVLTSTVGLEALAFDVPIGVLEIPGHPFAFEYVQRGAAVALHQASITAAVTELLEDSPERRAARKAFVDRHLHDRGRARLNVADVIEKVLAQGTP
jgi:hypothetical protein